MSSEPVLAASDLSPSADEAIRQAYAWAQRRGLELMLCQIVPRAGGDLLLRQSAVDAIEQTRLEARIAELLCQRAAALTGRSPDWFSIVVDAGTPYVELVRQAEELQAGLVVVGGHVPAGLGGLLIGNVAARVVRHAPCPVLVARAHTRSGRILVGVDLSDRSLAVLEAAAEEARLRRARLTVWTSIERQMLAAENVAQLGAVYPFLEGQYRDVRQNASSRIAAMLSGIGAEADVEVVDESPTAGLLEAAARLDADLVVVGAVGVGTPLRTTLGRVAEKVTGRCPSSVLVVRP
jgi:nucleotide-binding universal stress UspA family protein